MKSLPLALAVALGLLLSPRLYADAASHTRAAEELLGSMNMETVLSQSMNQMLKIQLQQNPTIAPFEPEMRAFFAKHMSWASLKPEMVKLYTTEFTEGELKELNNFYKTPVGKKAIEKMPLLMQKGAELGQQRVQQNLPELQKAIQEKAAAQQPKAP